MYPILYRKKTRTSYCVLLLCAAVCVRVLCQPVLRAAVWERSCGLLCSEDFYRAALFLQTGILSRKEAELCAASSPQGQTNLPGQPGAHTPAPSAEGGAAQSPAALPGQPGAHTPAPSAEGGAAQGQTNLPGQPGAHTPAPSAEGGATQSPAALPGQPGAHTPAPPATDAERRGAGLFFTADEAERIQLRGNCTYQVDKTALLMRPLGWKQDAGPKILIIHSHSCEAYTQTEGHTYLPSANYRTLELANNIVAVGDALSESLAALGVEVIHDRTYNDYPDYNRSYAVAREKIQSYLEQYPSITVVLDLHRDALDKPVREAVQWQGQTLAPLMLVVGSDEGGLSHPHWEENLSFALKLQTLGNREIPELFKALSFRRERFNADLTPGSVIIEVGSTENTLPEAMAAMPHLARWIALLCESGDL